MKYDTSGITLDALAAHLDAAYGFPIAAIEFTPQGEEAYSYIATSQRSERFFVRAQRGMDDDHLEGVYAALAALHDDCGIDAVLAPYRTRQGTFTSPFGSLTVAVFPFIPGTTAYESGIDEAQWGQTAEIIAALHTTARRCALPTLTRENFANPFAAPIRRALRRAASTEPPRTSYQAQVIALLREQQADVRVTLARLHRLGRVARRLPTEFVPTHGDPNLANILIDEGGSLHLTDWGELALGPRERDLTFFSEERFAPFLRRYLELTGPVRLHQTLFAFYLYRWVAQEIADYTARILDDSADAGEDAHAWAELQPYLPTDHAAIERGLETIMEVLNSLAEEGVVEVVAPLALPGNASPA